MIEVTFRIESLDYTDKLDSQLPLVLEALSQSGNINPVLKLACNTPEASSRIVKGILRTMSQDQTESRRPITGGVFICRSFILPSRACTSLPLFVCA